MKTFTDAERNIVTALIETKAVDFEVLGAALARHGAEATLQLDGEDFFCGTMRRFVRIYRLVDPVNPVEQLSQLSTIKPTNQG